MRISLYQVTDQLILGVRTFLHTNGSDSVNLRVNQRQNEK